MNRCLRPSFPSRSGFGARDQRQPRPGVRRARPGPRAARRRHRRGRPPAGCRVEVTGEGAGDLPDRRRATSSYARCGPPSTCRAAARRAWRWSASTGSRRPEGWAPPRRRSSAGVLLARALVVDGPRDSTTRRRCGWRPRSRATGQRRALPARRLHHRLDRAGGGRGPCGCRRAAGDPADGLRFPTERGLTAAARAALPATVPHADAAFNAGRAALLVHALTADPALLCRPPRTGCTRSTGRRGCRQTAALVDELRAAGVAAVVSGAGPTVLALTPMPDEFHPGIGWHACDVGGRRRRGPGRRGRLGHAERDPVAAGRKS